MQTVLPCREACPIVSIDAIENKLELLIKLLYADMQREKHSIECCNSHPLLAQPKDLAS